MRTLAASADGGSSEETASPGAVTSTAASETAKLLALQYFREKKRSERDRNIVLLARSRGWLPPLTHEEMVIFNHELAFPHINDDAIEVTLIQARDLNGKVIGVKDKDIKAIATAWVEYYITDKRNDCSVHLNANAKSKGASPAFAQSFVVPFAFTRSNARDKTAVRRLLRSRVCVVVQHKGHLLRPTVIGRGVIRLNEVHNKSEAKLVIKVSYRCVTVSPHRR